MILADFHVHSNFSPDSKTNIYDQIISIKYKVSIANNKFS